MTLIVNSPVTGKPYERAGVTDAVTLLRRRWAVSVHAVVTDDRHPEYQLATTLVDLAQAYLRTNEDARALARKAAEMLESTAGLLRMQMRSLRAANTGVDETRQMDRMIAQLTALEDGISGLVERWSHALASAPEAAPGRPAGALGEHGHGPWNTEGRAGR